MLPGKIYRPETILRIAWRRKWLLVCPLLLGLAGAAAWGSRLPDRYRSETVILLVPQRVPESYVRSTVSSRIESRLTSLREQILSRSRLERVIGEFQLYPADRQTQPMEQVVERMRDAVAVQPMTGDTFSVSYISTSPRLAMEVTNRLASLFIDENLRDREVVADHTSDFLDEQLQDARRRLIEHEKKLETYREAHSGELPSQQDANLQAIASLQMQLQSLAESVGRDRDRRLALQRVLNETAPSAAPAPSEPDVAAAPSTPADQLAAARAKLRDLEETYTAAHPDVIAQKRQIATLEEQVRTAPPIEPPRTASKPVVDPATPRRRDAQLELQQVEKVVAAKEAEERGLQRKMAGYQAHLDAAPKRESELVELTRDYETLRSLYTSLLVKREESKMSANLERQQIGEQFRVLDPARVPERPFEPNRTQLYLIGALAGLAVGLALVAGTEYRDTGLRTEEDVLLTLQVPVLATIPVIQAPRGVSAGTRSGT